MVAINIERRRSGPDPHTLLSLPGQDPSSEELAAQQEGDKLRLKVDAVVKRDKKDEGLSQPGRPSKEVGIRIEELKENAQKKLRRVSAYENVWEEHGKGRSHRFLYDARSAVCDAGVKEGGGDSGTATQSV